MSAWVVTKNHIDTLVYWIKELNLSPEEPDKLGQILWEENVASVFTLYGLDSLATCPGPDDLTIEEVEGYKYEAPRTVPGVETYYIKFDPQSPTQALVQVECYEYQTCEHAGWETSEAHRLYEALVVGLKRAGADPLSRTYDRAHWGV